MVEPPVTLALPLFKSNRFLGIIIENLETLDYGNLEILISDRHCADDALEKLKARFGHDARFHFIAARDEINWVEHFNLLLSAATGKYFFWMMHDDSYPPNYVRALVEPLEQYPDAVLAYGGLEALHDDGTRLLYRPDASFAGVGDWTLREIFRRFLAEHLLLAVRGIYRRAAVLRSGILILPTRDLFAADFVWTFATAFVGRWVCVSEVMVQKRFYPTSALAHWKSHTARHTFSEMVVLRKYLVSPARNVRGKLRGVCVIAVWAAIRLSGDFLYWTGMHACLHKPLQGMLDRWLRL
jgi:glycosyltransferase involved in cell wall biosynthesis